MTPETRPTARRRQRARATLAGTAVALAVWLVAAAPASAHNPQVTIFDATSQLIVSDPGAQARTLDRLQSLGVNFIRLEVSWRGYAPNPTAAHKPGGFNAADPGAYPQGQFGILDAAIRGAYARGMGVLLTPLGPAPDWASTGGGGLENPSPGEFQQFVQALGRRYSGSWCDAVTCNGPVPAISPAASPPVNFWSVWNEPNIELFLRPQRLNGRPYAGTLYRRLWLAAKKGLEQSGHGSDPVLIGETSPGPGRHGTPPLAFLRQVFCLNGAYRPTRSCAPLAAAGWAHHPYDPYDPPFGTSRGLLTIRSIGRLEAALRGAAGAGATTETLPILVTEYGVESVPDRVFGVSERLQAEYLGIAEFMLWRDPNVVAYSQYLMDDDDGGLLYSFQTGLRFHNDAPKLAYRAFPIALVVKRNSARSHRVSIWGHVRPVNGPTSVTVASRDNGGSARTLKTVRTDANGYFYFISPYRSGRRWHAAAHLADGRVLSGPFVRSFVFR